jgi:hypothetical protein
VGLEGVEDSMAAAEGFMGVAVTMLGDILVAVAMDGAAVVTAVAGMDGVGTVEDMVVVRTGMAVVPTGGGVTRTRMATVMVGKGASGRFRGAARRFRGAYEPAGDELLLMRGCRLLKVVLGRIRRSKALGEQTRTSRSSSLPVYRRDRII